MAEINKGDEFIKEIRFRSTESDIMQYLKTSIGGYTKSSVHDYLNLLRKQQQAMADTFTANQQALFDEKEHLSKDNESLKTRLGLVESEYKNLTEALRSQEIVGGECSVSDIIELRNRVAGLEEENRQKEEEKNRLESKISLLNRTIQDNETKLDQAVQEKQAVREMLKAEMLESKKQRNTVSRLSATLEEKIEEINFLNCARSSDQLSLLNNKIKELTEQIKSQSEMMKSCNSEASLKQQTIETLTMENDSHKKNIENLSKTLEELQNQNEKLMLTNNSLSDQLENEYKRSISLIKEKSGVTMEKLSAARKLDEAMNKVSYLEQQLKKFKDESELNQIFDSAQQIGEITPNASAEDQT